MREGDDSVEYCVGDRFDPGRDRRDLLGVIRDPFEVARGRVIPEQRRSVEFQPVNLPEIRERSLEVTVDHTEESIGFVVASDHVRRQLGVAGLENSRGVPLHRQRDRL